MGRLFTIEQDKEVAQLYQFGLSSIKLAKRYEVDKSTVLAALRRQGVVRRTNRNLTDAEEAEIVKIHTVGGFAVYRIARAYGVSRLQIKGALRRQGAKRKDGRFALTPAQEKQVAEAYTAGKTIPQIVDEFGFGVRSVRGALDRQGIEVQVTAFNKEEDKEITKLYNDGIGLLGLSRQFNVSEKAILNSLIRTDTERRPNRKHFFNEQAFDSIDDELSLYWAGFLYADSNVSDKALRIGLAIKDIEQLKRIRDFLDSDVNIVTRDNSCFVDFNSKYLVDRLHSIGIVNHRNKFHLLSPHIPEDKANHFIRGYLDGDGCISTNQQVVFLGQHDILGWIKDKLCKYAEASHNVSIRQRRGICEISWGGSIQSKRIVDWLYKDATIWMERKRKIARDW